MVFSQVRSLASKVLVVGALGLSALGSAQATLVVGEWDPAYGAPFDPVGPTALGWRGRVEFSVTNPLCLATAGTKLTSSGNDCSGTTITSAVVELYDITNPPLTLETLDLLVLLAWSANDVTALEISAPGVVSGSEINLSGLFNSPLAATYYVGPVSFQLDISLSPPSPYGVRMFWTDGTNNGFNEGNPTIEYSVPEPTSLLLAGAALLALGRRRSRSLRQP